jgi:hypothetical protein
MRARLSREEVVELAEEAEALRGWADTRRIPSREIPDAFDRLQRQSSAKEREQAARIRELEAEVQRLGAQLHEAIQHIPRKKRG